jgi:subtilisin family serine protease
MSILHDRFKFIPDYRILSRVQVLADKKDYNHELMNIPEMWRKTMGEGIKIAVLDTGVPFHPDLKRAEKMWSAYDPYIYDGDGHGTHCAGIIAAIEDNDMGVAGISPKSDMIYATVLDKDGSGDIDSIIRGINWAVETGADIISMSLGLDASVPNIRSFERACDKAVEAGVALFAAAGNEAGDVGQPARFDSVIAVAAVNNSFEHANFSNTGPEVDFAAGGVNVYSTYLNNSYARLSGTSMACPALAAVGALILSEHKKRGVKLSPEDLREHMKRIAFDVGEDGFDKEFGHGVPIFGKPENPQEVPPKQVNKKPVAKVFAAGAEVLNDTGSVDSAVAEMIRVADKHLNGDSRLD